MEIREKIDEKKYYLYPMTSLYLQDKKFNKRVARCKVCRKELPLNIPRLYYEYYYKTHRSTGYMCYRCGKKMPEAIYLRSDELKYTYLENTEEALKLYEYVLSNDKEVANILARELAKEVIDEL